MNTSKQKIVAFALWGYNKVYTEGAVENAILVKKLYGSDWIARFYIDATFSDESILKRLRDAGADIIFKYMDPAQTIIGMTWRFLPADDPCIDVMLSRDCDSRISEREVQAVNEWLASDCTFHVIRDHPQHGIGILGGTWGCRGGILGIGKMLALWETEKGFSVHGDDQLFLQARVWNIVQPNCMAHDAYFQNTITQKITRVMNPPKMTTGYVGSSVWSELKQYGSMLVKPSDSK